MKVTREAPAQPDAIDVFPASNGTLAYGAGTLVKRTNHSDEALSRGLPPTVIARLFASVPRIVVVALTGGSFVALRLNGLLGDLPLPALLPLLIGAGIMSEAHFQFARTRQGYGFSVVIPLVAVTVVIYSIGWGPALAIGYLYPLGEAYKLERPPSLPLTVTSIWLGLAGGELAFGAGLVHSYIPSPYVHGLAVLSGLGVAFVLHMISETNAARVEAATALSERESSFRHLFANNPNPMWVYDERSLAILAVNDAAVHAYGYDEGRWLSMSITDIRPPEEEQALMRHLHDRREDYQQSGGWRHLRADGTVIDVEITSHRTNYLGHAGVLVTAIDTTERKALERDLNHRADHDDLTGLFNRAYLRRQVIRSEQQAESKGLSVALLLLDLDAFRELNLSLGSDVGDMLLCKVSSELVGLMPDATVARVGSDEFAILFMAPPSAIELRCLNWVSTALARLNEPFPLGGATLSVEASVGIAIGPRPVGSETMLLSHAQEALTVAQGSLRRIEIQDVRFEQGRKTRLAVVSELRAAIDHGELLLHYQPQMDLAATRVVGLEALVRWQHPQRGLIGPDSFVPLAERTGLIGPLTSFVLKEAIAQLGLWRKLGLELTMSVNLGAANLTDEALPEFIDALLGSHGCRPEHLILEITEGTVMVESERITAVVNQLSRIGSQLSVDDFGTANSSLSRLRALPFAELKLDKSFVAHLDSRWEDLTIVRSSINLAHDLGLRVVAEGIDSGEVANVLRDLGCEVGQGYWLSKPKPAPEITEWLEHERHR